MIDQKLMKKFLASALKKLHGEWIVIGGTVLPLMGIDHRVTMDIDFINLNFKNSTKETIQLMEIAESIGLPVEAINQAGAYYLSQIENINDHLVVIEKSKNCTIFRPDAFLYISLKISRLSETDLADCQVFIKKNKAEVLLHQKEIKKIVTGHLKKANPEIERRLEEILSSLH